MKIGLFCPEVPGHLNPMTTLASELVAQGHEVTMVGCQRAASIVARAQLPFYPLGPDDPLNEKLEAGFRLLGTTSGFQAMMQTGKIYALHCQLSQKYLPQALNELNLDGLVIDQVCPVPALEAERRGLPYAVACNALAVYWDPLVPPPPLAWDYRNDWFGRARNELAKHMVLAAYYWFASKRETVDPLLLIREVERGVIHVAQQPDFFEYPRTTYPPNLHFTGPWHRAARDDATVDFPWDWLDGRPLIYASMGTLQNNLNHVFHSIVEAVKDLPMQVVLSKGGGLVDLPGKLPDNVLVVERAPQLRLLERAKLVITHAGMNTALECLAQGVPMLCLPVTNDQPGVAKRVEYLGNGRCIPVRHVTTARLQRELTRMLQDDSFQRKATQFADRLATYDGAEMAAKLIVQALHSQQPVPNPAHAAKSAAR
ncbi:glycosyltransferase [Bremerella cremea]|uniref:Glycosyltransferase n=1 Tax=Bremerella cremea TaxID=1031537 RepID=A0A368KVD0_9BACT|nr:nucleotide disphospho-sugar-binding domain-containing protein [Bremerella cremea]RCS52842.1 glycosyltransferase [Bremerella cremea]